MCENNDKILQGVLIYTPSKQVDLIVVNDEEKKHWGGRTCQIVDMDVQIKFERQ